MEGERSTALRHRALRATLLIVGVVVGLGALWLLLGGMVAQRSLSTAGENLQRARNAIEAGDRSTARKELGAAQRATARARFMTSGPVWRTAAAVPWVGRTPRAVSTVAQVSDAVARLVLPPLADVAADIDVGALRTADGIDLVPLQRAAPALELAQHRMLALRQVTDAIHGPLIWPVGARVGTLRQAVTDLTGVIDVGVKATALIPPMMGTGGTRTYLLAVQNPAEARGTGGLLGAYGVVEAVEGRVTIRDIGPNSALRDTARLRLDVPPDFVSLYGNDPALWANANLSPYFPYAARIWLRLWELQHQERLDGVIAVDPIALGRIVGATQPVTLPDGTRLTGTSAANFLMRDVYERFPSFEQSTERDRLLAGIGAAMARNLFGQGGDVGELVTGVRKSVRQGRILVYSDHRDEQGLLAGTPISGAPTRTRAPQLLVVVNNGAANKLDFYLDRSVRWQLGRCVEGSRRSRVTVALRNDAPAVGLPAYVVGNRDLPRDGKAVPPGTNRVLVTVFSTHAARLVGAELDDVELSIRRGRERGQTVTAFTVDLASGQTRIAVLEFDEPARPERPTLAVQPLVRQQRSVVEAEQCAT